MGLFKVHRSVFFKDIFTVFISFFFFFWIVYAFRIASFELSLQISECFVSLGLISHSPLYNKLRSSIKGTRKGRLQKRLG